MDNDSYLVTHITDRRKDYIVFRPRLKVFGPIAKNDTTEVSTDGTRPAQKVLSNGDKPDQNFLTEGKGPDQTSDPRSEQAHENRKPTYNLRNEKIDYRPFF